MYVYKYLVTYKALALIFTNSDLSTTNLQYLTSKQSLADIAAFVVGIRQKHSLSPTQKWIAFGGSYPGSLAAWAREKYPDLIWGSISSSGPLLAKVDFTGKRL